LRSNGRISFPSVWDISRVAIDRHSKYQGVPRVCKRSPRASQVPGLILWIDLCSPCDRLPVTGYSSDTRFPSPIWLFLEKSHVRTKCIGLRQGNIIVKVGALNDQGVLPNPHRPCLHQLEFSTHAVCGFADTHILAAHGFPVIATVNSDRTEYRISTAR
jgi:hypothetical protein